ncbi:MAG: hypothetical protein IJW16_07300 [Clostridia bacterium]|nr:hypothetical protein [Clostridia bacterium]
MKKLAALLLCLCMMAGLVSCAADQNGDVPNGMQIASVAGADYFLYVPTTWNLNTYYGVSGAYFNLENLSNVSMEKYEMTDAIKGEMTAAALEDSASARIAWYYQAHCKNTVEQLALTGSLTVEDAGSVTTLGGANAMQFRTKATVNGVPSHFHWVIAERNQAFYVFTFSVRQDLYEMLWPDVQSMLSVFAFSDTPYQPEAGKVIEGDVEIPAGMKLASNDEVAYRFFVPASWVINQNERVFSAYVESDRSSVSVVPYMPDAESMSVAEYSKMTKDKLIEIVGEEGYEVVEPEAERTLGGRVAIAHHYRLTIEGRTYEYLQVIAAYKSMIYSVTYTAPSADAYQNHIAEVEQILGAFAFR